MSIMWANLSLVYVLSFMGRYYSRPLSMGSEFVKINKLFTFLVILCFIFVSGLRTNIGDTYFYKYSYTINTYSLQNINFSDDFGFNILQMFLQYISKDPQILILVTAIATNFLIVIVLYRYSRMFELSVYIYITSGMFTTSMNGIRQYLAAAIVFSATKYLLEGNFKKYSLIVLIAASFHKSALILLPIYFIVRREAWTKLTFVLLCVAVGIVLEFNQFSNVLFSALDNTQYEHYKDFSEGGANFIRALVTAVPLIIAFIGRKRLRELWPESDYIVNLSIISLVFIIIALKNWIFARFNIYFDLYNLILLSWIVKLFKENDRAFIYYAILICYLLYFSYEHLIEFNFVYTNALFNF